MKTPRHKNSFFLTAAGLINKAQDPYIHRLWRHCAILMQLLQCDFLSFLKMCILILLISAPTHWDKFLVYKNLHGNIVDSFIYTLGNNIYSWEYLSCVFSWCHTRHHQLNTIIRSISGTKRGPELKVIWRSITCNTCFQAGKLNNKVLSKCDYLENIYC